MSLEEAAVESATPGLCRHQGRRIGEYVGETVLGKSAEKMVALRGIEPLFKP